MRRTGESELAARYLTVMVAMPTVAVMAPLGRRQRRALASGPLPLPCLVVAGDAAV
ncbi:hypothetical protein [Thermoflexus sp.]|uniref:hypothetical protein n=1 Tax=Thermoflexus sp. TaxID=1969742 RepID=UPI0035E41E59